MLDKVAINMTKLAKWVVTIPVVLILVYLTFFAFCTTFNAGTSEPMRANWIFHFVIVALVVIFLFAIGSLNSRPKLCKWISCILFIGTLLFIARMCSSFIMQTLILPEGDSAACMTLATWFYESNFSAVVPKDSYLSLWPFQTGFIFYLEKTMRIFKETGSLLFQKINCLYVLFMFVSGYGIVCAISKRIESKVAYLLLACTYSSILFSVTEIYGDLPAYAWMMFASLCFILWSRNGKKAWIWLLLFNGSIILACVYKRNCLIHAIAFLLVFLVIQLKKRQLIYSLITIVSFIIAILGTGITTKYYEMYAQNTCGKGVPVMAFVAMGLQYEDGGGWNGFHANTYMETGYNYDETVRISKESIADSLSEFKKNPGLCVDFFHNKVLVQWTNATHGVFWGLGNCFNSDRNPEAYWVYYLIGQKYHKTVPFMDIHQSVLYGMLLFSGIICLKRLIKKENQEMEYMVSFAALIGGFLFSLFWEAQTGAVMYYIILLLPASLGIIGTEFEKVAIKK